MLSRLILLSFLTLALGAFAPSAFAVTTEEFKAVYDSLQRQTLDRSGEVAEIDSFTYVKDVATFRFGKGTMLLQRPVHGRPTLAAFVGQGHIQIAIPVAVEREALENVAGDSTIDEDFSVCVFRIGDDFDQALKSRFNFQKGQMGTTDFGKVRDAQGEYFFKPTLADFHDNITELAVSVFERAKDGFFYAAFNKKMFLFDPNRPEEVTVADSDPLRFALSSLNPSFRRSERIGPDPELLSEMNYQISPIRHDAILEMGGSDGWSVERAQIRAKVVIRADSLRVVRLFLDPHLTPDSIRCNKAPVAWFRRYEFYHLELLLDRYARQGDTLTVDLWLHDVGNSYNVLRLFTDDRSLSRTSIQLIFPKEYEYAAPARSERFAVDNSRVQCQAGPLFCRNVPFMAMPSGYDTSTLSVNEDLALTFIRPTDIIHLRQEFVDTTIDAYRYFYENFGLPSNLSKWYVLPFGPFANLGMIGYRLNRTDKNTGGFYTVAGQGVAPAWFDPTFQPKSYREEWMREAVPRYLGLLYTQQRAGGGPLYTQLNSLRTGAEDARDHKVEAPLAIGDRSGQTVQMIRGVWLLHMLRTLMFDAESMKEDVFWAFLRDLVELGNQQKFSNTDFCHLAEQHFGSELDWFFDPWLYKRGFPDFDVTWKTAQESDGFYVDMHILTSRVDLENVYPVMLRVTVPAGSALLRQGIAGAKQDYRIGPFREAPTDLKFNEYESVLCQSKIRKL